MSTISGIEWTEDDLEPGDRLLEDQSRMQALLRREDVEAAPGHGSREV